jgi:hypothetical protein
MEIDITPTKVPMLEEPRFKGKLHITPTGGVVLGYYISDVVDPRTRLSCLRLLNILSPWNANNDDVGIPITLSICFR